MSPRIAGTTSRPCDRTWSTYGSGRAPSGCTSRASTCGVKETSPALSTPGMSLVRIDAEGRLLELQVLPSGGTADAGDGIDWTPVLDRAALETQTLVEVEPAARPLLSCDQRVAWESDLGGSADRPLRIEGCGAGGKPLYFEVFAPWDEGYDELRAGPSDVPPASDASGAASLVLSGIRLTLLLSAFIGGALLARRNVRLGRTDRTGAFRIGVVIFSIGIASEILYANHVASMAEFLVLSEAMAHILFVTLVTWYLYLAIEPFVRRLWPSAIIAWRRVLEGSWRDPLVGRDVLIGAAVAQILIFGRLDNAWWPPGGVPPLMGAGPLWSISGLPMAGAWFLEGLGGRIGFALGVTTVIVLARILLRKDWLTWLVVTTIIVTMMTLTFLDNIPSGQLLRLLLGVLVIQGAFIFLIIRVGLVAVVAYAIFANMSHFIRVLDPSSWFFGYSLFYLACFITLAVLAFWVSLGSRKLLRGDLLDV